MAKKAKKSSKQKVYTKTHESAKALKSHVKKIKARGGNVTVKGNTITYSF